MCINIHVRQDGVRQISILMYGLSEMLVLILHKTKVIKKVKDSTFRIPIILDPETFIVT
jgi:hypothetical protein